uniref:Hyaluronidase n=1 Tax=Brugia malayi TaxID=6279 RepID=A0A0J9Y8S7_BRUMA|nr:BMA-CHHY-1 [Brugia malayi]
MKHLFVQILPIIWLTTVNGREWKTFEVRWNVPTHQCKNWSEIQKPEHYGILVNDEYKFYGNVVVTLYEEKFGLYPYYKNYSNLSSAVNGGIPQRANLTEHLLKVENDTINAIPNENFDGLAIIDYEKWRPLYEHNWSTKRIYRNASIDYVKERYENITQENATSIAIKEFNEAAMKFLTATIREVKRIRPKALWGFYGMPFCNYSAGINGTVACGEVYEEFNDRLKPLYMEATALYPSIYLPRRNSGAGGCLYVTSVLQEAKRCAEKLKPSVPIFTFTGFEYFPLNLTDPFYTEQDLFNSLHRSFDMGIQGAIIWSTSKDMANRCLSIGNYIRDHLGPEVENLKKLSEICDNAKTNRITANYTHEPLCAMRNGLYKYCHKINKKWDHSFSTSIVSTSTVTSKKKAK